MPLQIDNTGNVYGEGESLIRKAKGEESGQLSLLLSLLLLGISGFSSIAFALVVLDVLIVDGKGLINLCPESSLILNTVAKLVDAF